MNIILTALLCLHSGGLQAATDSYVYAEHVIDSFFEQKSSQFEPIHSDEFNKLPAAQQSAYQLFETFWNPFDINSSQGGNEYYLINLRAKYWFFKTELIVFRLNNSKDWTALANSSYNIYSEHETINSKIDTIRNLRPRIFFHPQILVPFDFSLKKNIRFNAKYSFRRYRSPR